MPPTNKGQRAASTRSHPALTAVGPGHELINPWVLADLRFGAIADSSRTSREVREVPHPDSCTAAKNKLPTIGFFGWTRFWLKGDRTSYINFKARRSERRRLWPRGLRAESPCRVPLRASHFRESELP